MASAGPNSSRPATFLRHSPEAGGESVLPADWAPGIGAAVKVRISARARRISLRISEAERAVLLVLPPGVPLRRGLRFLAA